jgi:general transcription factor 3C polypeptide 3 (transcription factor C subunit 4)
MFAALTRLCPSPTSWYASGPSQKFLLRQIKIMDRTLIAAETGENLNDDDGPELPSYPSKELDPTLLVLYGHVLFTSGSFTYALSKSPNSPASLSHC